MTTSISSPIKVTGVTKSFDSGNIQVLRGVDLSVPRGKLVSVCGPSGCGKSTLLHIIAGIESAENGSVFIEGQPLNSEKRRLDALRHTIGFIFQLHNLIPDLTMEENCIIPTIATEMDRGEALERFHQLAKRTGLSHRTNNRIQDLSGGERQRTAICRALMNSPSVVVADEPTGALDEKTSWSIFSLLGDLVVSHGVTMIMATHDMELAKNSDRVIQMRDGLIE
ncbi:ABC transporter ATP-binding protein (plasmid) [Verrucomicrobiaceae bacterium 227]